MKRIKKHLQRINKEWMKKGITTLILLFFAMVMLFQKDNVNTNTELQFVRNMDETLVHGAANNQRDYLFQNEAGNDVYQGQMTDGQRRTGKTPPATEDTDTMDNLINPNEIEQVTKDMPTTGTYTGVINTGATGQIEPTTSIPLDCMTPWGEQVKNTDFVLAYQQRKDVNSICNVEKRVCKNGVLGGTFAQSSCKDDIVYNYKRAEAISYNQKILNDYIQPTPAKNAGATFDTEGKINTTKDPTTTRNTTNTSTTTQSSIEQTTPLIKNSCITPREQTIEHGQFVKAYKTPRGFLDFECEVELRPCVNGTLKGTYAYDKCTFNNTTYADYLTAGSPTSNTGFLFFDRIKKILGRRR